jgi:hypothetical protein
MARPMATAPLSAVPAKKQFGPRIPCFCEAWKSAAGWSPST